MFYSNNKHVIKIAENINNLKIIGVQNYLSMTFCTALIHIKILKKLYSKIDQHLVLHLSITVDVFLVPSLSMQSNKYPFF